MQSSVAKQSAPSLSTSALPVTIRLGTRTSQLALWQTNHVVARLQSHWPHLHCELIHLVTQGDKRLDRPLPEIGGKGLFTAELEDALRRGEIDLAVHSLKDLPVENPNELIIGAILSREDTRDVLVAREAWTLATLPKGAVIGTSSLRRQAQLLAARPDLVVRSIRGNVDTRLRKVLSGEYDAAVMAGAGLSRLGLTEHITEWLAPETMLPAPGQGALAVQCRANDPAIQAILAPIHDASAAATTTAERQLLLRLGGGCSAPIGAWATVENNRLELRARVTSTDGQLLFDAQASGSDPFLVAQEAATTLFAQGAQRALGRTQQSLSGKRIVVTRPQRDVDSQEDELTKQLQLFGATTVAIPAIHLVPIKDNTSQKAIDQLATYDWILFTSANAVEHFWAVAPDKLLATDRKQPKIAAVGPATQMALTSRGVAVDLLPEKYLGVEIAYALKDATSGKVTELAGAKILLPRSAQGGSDLPDALRQQGAVVEDIALYTPVGSPIDEKMREQLLGGVDVVTFASGSAVRAFASALQGDPRFSDFWQKVVVACIGPATAEVARSSGLPVHIVATEHTAAGLVAAIVAYFEQGLL